MGSVPYQARHRIALAPFQVPAVSPSPCLPALRRLAPESEPEPVFLSKEPGKPTVFISWTAIPPTTFPFLTSEEKRKK